MGMGVKVVAYYFVYYGSVLCIGMQKMGQSFVV